MTKRVSLDLATLAAIIKVALPQKSELKPTAPKARNRKARGKRVAEAERVAPGQLGLGSAALKERNHWAKREDISHFQCSPI